MIRSPLVAVAVFLGCFSALIGKEKEVCSEGKRPHRTSVRHIESGGIGYTSGYTTFETFLSRLDGWAVTPFLDVRGHVFDDGKWAANAGVGLRAIWGERVYGINTYYDYRNSSHFQSNQVGAGLETLGELFDFRINGYFPFGKKIGNGYDPIFSSFEGHNMLIAPKYRFAMTGADAEFGFHFGKSEHFDFYAATGPYYFIGKLGGGAWGGKARVAGVYKETFSIEISDSYDGTFHNNLQGQIGFSWSIGPRSKVKKEKSAQTCTLASALNARLVQPVGRQEIIVMDKKRKDEVAIDPATGLPYFFVFVDNTSSSDGTYESPYHNFTQAQTNSSPNDIIYVFPGDGTTTGMNAGIFLKANQKLWGSGVNHSIQTSVGTTSIPAQSSASPIITNTDADTEGNAVTLANNNSISGFTITSPMNDAIYGTNTLSLEVSSCTFSHTTTYPIEATFPGSASISITNNQFLNNVNGIFLTLNGTSTVVCSNNTFQDQTSVSSFPLGISAIANVFTAYIENNVFNSNRTGSILVHLNEVVDATINVLNNTMTNSGTGFASSLGSSFVISSDMTTQHCSVVLNNNTFSNNTLLGDVSNSLYMHTSGAITNLEITASSNTMSNNAGSAMVLGTPTDTLTLLVTDNTITGCHDNGIAILSSTPSTTGTITISNNTISAITNTQNAIAITQAFSNLDLTISNNEINGCEGSGILCFASEFTNMSVDISDNVISNCQNLGGGNAGSAISLDTYIDLAATVANNTFSSDVSPAVAIGVNSSGNPTVCLTLTGNNSDTDPSYSLTNPGSGAFNLSPCDVDAVNTGTINPSGDITPVQSCPEAAPCP